MMSDLHIIYHAYSHLL